MNKVVTAVSTAIGKVFDFFKVSKEKQSETFTLATVKRMRIALNAAEEYIRITSKTEVGQLNKKLKNLEERFFKYNN